MKQVLWFCVGAMVGAAALAGIQWLQKPAATVTFEDLKIAAAPGLYPPPPPLPSPQGVDAHSVSAPRTTYQPAQSAPVTNRSYQTQPAAPPPQQSYVASTPPPAPKGQEMSVFLDRQQQINTPSDSYSIFVHDHGSETISVSVGYGPTTRVKKAFGSDSVGDNKALIYSDDRVRLFHINSPRAPQNCCLIEVVAAS